MKEPLVRNGGGSPKVSPCSHKPEPICKEVAARIWKEERNLLDRVKEKKNKENCQKTAENHEEVGDGIPYKIRGHP